MVSLNDFSVGLNFPLILLFVRKNNVCLAAILLPDFATVLFRKTWTERLPRIVNLTTVFSPTDCAAESFARIAFEQRRPRLKFDTDPMAIAAANGNMHEVCLRACQPLLCSPLSPCVVHQRVRVD